MSLKVCRSEKYEPGGIVPMVYHNVGWYKMPPLSNKAIAWLRENEPGFKARFQEITEAALNEELLQLAEVDLPPDRPKRNKAGFVYVLYADKAKAYKIGITKAKCPEKRIMNIQVSCPYQLNTLVTFHCADCEAVEADIHDRLSDYRKSGEWFKLPSPSVLNKALEYHGVQV
jgi:hypothetical protein